MKQTKKTSKIVDLRGGLKTADLCGAVLLFELNLAQAQPKPGLAQARFLEISKSGTWKSGNLGSKKNQQKKTKSK